MVPQEQREELPITKDTFLERVIDPILKGKNPLLRQAFADVDRGLFAPEDVGLDLIYDNKAIQLGDGLSLSEPEVVAQMIHWSGLSGREKVLEIGTGTGYSTAILSKRAAEVHTIEFNPVLAIDAHMRLRQLGFDTVAVHPRDGALGYPEAAPYDAVIVTAGAREIPQALIDQLRDGGRIVLPVGKYRDHLELIVGIKYMERILSSVLYKVAFFHSLYSEAHGGWSKDALERDLQLKRKVLEIMAKNSGKPLDEFCEEARIEAKIPEGTSQDEVIARLKISKAPMELVEELVDSQS